MDKIFIICIGASCGIIAGALFMVLFIWIIDKTIALYYYIHNKIYDYFHTTECVADYYWDRLPGIKNKTKASSCNLQIYLPHTHAPIRLV